MSLLFIVSMYYYHMETKKYFGLGYQKLTASDSCARLPMYLMNIPIYAPSTYSVFQFRSEMAAQAIRAISLVPDLRIIELFAICNTYATYIAVKYRKPCMTSSQH